jgi:hypothetical protein
MKNYIEFIAPLFGVFVGLLLYFSKNPAYSKYKKYWYVLVILGAFSPCRVF